MNTVSHVLHTCITFHYILVHFHILFVPKHLHNAYQTYNASRELCKSTETYCSTIIYCRVDLSNFQSLHPLNFGIPFSIGYATCTMKFSLLLLHASQLCFIAISHMTSSHSCIHVIDLETFSLQSVLDSSWLDLSAYIHFQIWSL